MGRQQTISGPPHWLQVSIGCHITYHGQYNKLCYQSGQLLLSAPSAPPTYVKVSNVTSTTITIQWGKVNCKHHNGRIIGYSVRYGPQNNLNTTLSISGESVNMTTISNLRASTTYEIEVATVNSAGTGAFSPVLIAHTQPSECILMCKI